MTDTDQPGEPRMPRRQVIRRAAVGGAALVWTVPVIRHVTPQLGQAGSPPPVDPTVDPAQTSVPKKAS